MQYGQVSVIVVFRCRTWLVKVVLMRSPDNPAEIEDPNPPPIKPVDILMLSPMLSIEPGSEMTCDCE